MGGWSPWIGLLSLVLAGIGVSRAPQFDIQAACWPLVGALLMEFAAVPLPGFGFFSMATPFYIAMLLHPQIGLIPALLVAVGSALVRSMLTGYPTWSGRTREVLGQVSPLIVTATLITLLKPYLGPGLQGLFCLQFYLLAAWQGPRRLARETLQGEALSFWDKVYTRTLPVTGGVVCAGLFMASYQGQSSWLLLACPVLLALRQSFQAAVITVEALEQEALRGRLRRSEHDRDAAREEGDRTRQELTMKADEVAVLEELSRALAENLDLVQTMDLIIQIVGRTVTCQTAAIFCPEQGELFPVRFHSPQAQRLSASRLLKIQEPIVRLAWQTGAIQEVQADEPRTERLLEGEAALALPLERLGVLYVGDARRVRFLPEDVQRLRPLAAQAAVCLRCAQYLVRLQQSLAEYSWANERLQTWTQGLDRVLEGTRALNAAPDPAGLEVLLRQSLQAIAPHEFFWCVQSPQQPAADSDQHTLLEVARTVWESGRPLLFEDLSQTRFALASGRLRSLLAAPLLDAQGVFAVVLVGAANPRQFTRLTQDLLSVLSFQAGAVWQNTRARHELAEAYRKLQESEAQLIQSGKLAAVGQLAAGVAHELNSPLGAVILGIEGAITCLKRKPEKVQERLESASAAAERAQEIVSKLLFYSREGLQGIRPFDLNQVVEDTLAIVSHQFSLDQVEVVRELGPIPRAVGNQGEIQQVLLNLLFNARDAVQEEAATAPRIRVSTRGESGWVVLEVADCGPGIEPVVLERIFEPFFTTKPVGKGTGLGLSVSLQIVRQHEGSLTVTSTPGQGACFTLSLPIEQG